MEEAAKRRNRREGERGCLMTAIQVGREGERGCLMSHLHPTCKFTDLTNLFCVR